jgi:hypothetical protein
MARTRRELYLPESAEIAPGFPWVRGRAFWVDGFNLRADHVAGASGRPIAWRVVRIHADGTETLYNWTPARASDLPPDVNTPPESPTPHPAGRVKSGPRPADPRVITPLARRWLNAARHGVRTWWGRSPRWPLRGSRAA